MNNDEICAITGAASAIFEGQELRLVLANTCMAILDPIAEVSVEIWGKLPAGYDVDNRDWGGYLTCPKLKNRNPQKFLIFKPQARLSLQTHRRRSEYWRLVSGEAKAIVGFNCFPVTEDSLFIQQGRRHRGIGGKNGAIVHEYYGDGSSYDELDIVRIEDDHGRQTVGGVFAA